MRVFVNTVRLGSMAKAAKELSVTPPTISKTISKLENELGVQLIVRTTRKNYLTESGQLYFESCNRILNEIDETHRALTDENKACKGLIRINAPVSFSQHVLYEAVHQYQLVNPGIKFSVQCNDELVDLVDSAFDLSVRITETLEDSSARARLVSKTQLKLCASKEYIEKHGKLSSPNDIKEHNCITYSNTNNGRNCWRTLWQNTEQYIEINGDLVVNNGDVAVNFALRGKGLTLQPDFIVRPHLKSGELVEILPDIQWPILDIYLVYPNTKHVSGKVRSFINFLAHYFSDDNCLLTEQKQKSIA
jgi:DNA-binding transcriptional LysR family regulator